MPKVSICIPTYNNVSEVSRLLRSVYEQEYTDFEVNISDDSTNEEIADLVKSIKAGSCWQDISLSQKAKQHSHLKLLYVHNEKPLGHIYNWNNSIKMAKGEYIKIMFSDDWFTYNTSLGDLVTLLDSKPQAMLAFCGSRQVMLDGAQAAVKHIDNTHRKDFYDRGASETFIKNLKKDYRRLFMGNQIGAPSAVIYRRGSRLSLFDEDSNWASDMFLYFELLQQSPIFAYTTKPLVSIGVHEHQYTESFEERDMRIYNDYRYMYEKYQLKESEECRAYFTEKFIIKYKKGIREARALGISYTMYYKKWFNEQRDTIRCFINARTHRRE